MARTRRSPKCLKCPVKNVCQSYPDPQDFIVTKKTEPGRSENGKHVPRRIYRGRIVEFLRARPATISVIGRKIKKDWSAKDDRQWLVEILQRLQKDDMIIYINKKWQLK